MKAIDKILLLADKLENKLIKNSNSHQEYIVNFPNTAAAIENMQAEIENLYKDSSNIDELELISKLLSALDVAVEAANKLDELTS